MSDYVVKVSVRNGRILSRMRAAGYETQTALAKAAGVTAKTLNSIVALRRAPLSKNGTWSHGVEDIAGALGCDPEDLFTEAQLTMALRRNSAETYMSEPQAVALMSGDMEQGVWASIEAQRLLPHVEGDRRREVIGRRIDGDTLEDIAADWGVSSMTVLHEERRALRDMRRVLARASGGSAGRMSLSVKE